MWKNKDWLDQPAHLAVGLLGTYILCIDEFVFGIRLSYLESVIIVLTWAFVRELGQHDWEASRVGVLDLAFFAIGCGLAALFI